jgi:putative transposase
VAQESTPSAARIERQAVQTTAQDGERGYDGGKTITGRTRPSSVEVLGLWLVGCVRRAAIAEAGAAPPGLQPLALAPSPRLAVLGAESTYHHHGLSEWRQTEAPGHWRLAGGRRPDGSQGGVLGPTRWVVERPLAWLGRWWRNRKDDERRTDSRASMLRSRARHRMRKRLKPAKIYRPFCYQAVA